jgi:D-alanyl-D-alanine carboxypeptidase (penicillin-binding protein 5/6)
VDATSALTNSITYNVDPTPGITKGEQLGTITFSANGKVLATVPAIALADAPPASFLTKLKHKLSTYL